MRTGGLWPGPPPTGLAKLASSMVAGWGAQQSDFLPEDKAICERGQRAASGDFHPGRLTQLERVVDDFHRFLARRLS